MHRYIIGHSPRLMVPLLLVANCHNNISLLQYPQLYSLMYAVCSTVCKLQRGKGLHYMYTHTLSEMCVEAKGQPFRSTVQTLSVHCSYSCI